MLLIVLLLLSFNETDNHKLAEPLENLIEMFIKLSFQNTFVPDIFVGLAFEDSSLYSLYTEVELRFSKLCPGIIALHFNKDDIPLRTRSAHVLYTDSLSSIEWVF